MKKGLKNLKENERQRILNNFYSKQIKKGKTTNAAILDKISIGIVVFILLIILLNKLIGNLVISFFLALTIMSGITKLYKRVSIKEQKRKIEKLKLEYKSKLVEEKVLTEDEDLEDYVISRYYEKRSDLRSNIDFFKKDKIFKLYFLFIILYGISFFTAFSTYYKIMAVISFIMATGIGSYNITEYIRMKGKNDLLNKDIDV